MQNTLDTFTAVLKTRLSRDRNFDLRRYSIFYKMGFCFQNDEACRGSSSRVSFSDDDGNLLIANVGIKLWIRYGAYVLVRYPFIGYKPLNVQQHMSTRWLTGNMPDILYRCSKINKQCLHSFIIKHNATDCSKKQLLLYNKTWRPFW